MKPFEQEGLAKSLEEVRRLYEMGDDAKKRLVSVVGRTVDDFQDPQSATPARLYLEAGLIPATVCFRPHEDKDT